MFDFNDVQGKIRKYHALPEAIVIDKRTIGYPFFFLTLDLTYVANRELELQEEFVLKCIKNHLISCLDISLFLGIEETFIERIVSSLLFRELLIFEDHLKLTESGNDALERQTILSTFSETFTCYIDALTGKIPNLFNVNRANRDSYIPLQRVISKPRNIEDLINYHEEIQGLLRFQENKERLDLIQINKVEKCYTIWHELDLVLYKNTVDDVEISYEIFSRGSIATEYREAIERLYAKGERVLDLVLQLEDTRDSFLEDDACVIDGNGIDPNDVVELEKLKARLSAINDADSFSAAGKPLKEERNSIIHQLKDLKNKTQISEIIHTLEHRDYLFQAIKESKKRLMIVSPWIRSNVVDRSFTAELEKALERKVEVYILYGMKQRPKQGQQNDIIAIKALKNLADKYKNLYFEQVKNTHRKIIVSDDLFGVVTSFNFLSFRADPNLTYRDELGVVLRDKKTISDLFQSGLNLPRAEISLMSQ